MFITSRSILLIFVSLFAFSFNANAAEIKTISLDVPGMTCKFCPITIRKALEKVPGVTEVKAEFETNTAVVTFDPSLTNIQTLTKTTANAGYPSTVKE